MGRETRIDTASSRPLAGRTGRTRVMIVDDSLTVRSALSRMIESQPDLEVAGKTSSAELALKDLEKLHADVVLLDLEMPGMGGLDALPRILAAREGIQVLVVSTLTEEGAEPTLAALAMGAADTMPKPRSGGFSDDYREALFAKIRALGAGRRTEAQTTAPVRGPRPAPQPRRRPELLALGASTGGIHALGIFLRQLPNDFDLPILVTQHLPGSFMSVLARQLELAAARKAVVAEDGMVLTPRQIFVAPGDGHLLIRREAGALVCRISRKGSLSGCTPSVDPMLESVAQATDGQALAVVFSGMGRDGVHGARALVASGGTVMAQDRESSAVWGMPRAVTEEGLASAVLPPSMLAARVAAQMNAAAWM